MDAVQAGNSAETPAEEAAGILETEGVEATLEEQAGTEEIEATLEGQAEAEELEVPVAEQADTEEIEATLEEQAEAEELEVPVEEQADTEDLEATLEEPTEAEELEVPVEEQADTEELEATLEEPAEAEEIEVPVEERASTVNGDVPSEEENDLSQMGGIPVADWDYQRPKRGEVRTGIILSIGEQEIIVDVGAKRDGIVPYADMQRMGEEELAKLRVGDELPVYVLRPEDQEGNLLISLFMARQQKAWIRAQELADSGESWEGTVIGYNKGGLVIPVDEIRGFVPASQVPGFPHGLNQEERLTRLSTMVDETMPVKVIEINRRKRRLILSATAAQQDWRKQARTRLLNDLREGEVREGTVSSLCSFGAFVDLGGADGLVHLSELSWRRIRHPREAVSVGDKVEVYVLRLDNERQRIGLSLKRLLPEPWALVEDKYELGQLVEGVVTNVVDFGAFAEVEDGVEGLIHVSELAEASISHPRDVVKKGDLLLLRVIRIDTRRKRLGLSLKRVLESEWAEWAARLAAADVEKQAAARKAEEAVAEAAEEAVEVADASADEAADESVAEVIEEPVAEVVEEAAEAADASADESVEEPADEPVAEVVEEAAEAVEEPVAEAVEEVAEAADASADESVEEPSDEPVAEVVEEAVEAADASADESVEEPADEPMAEVVEEAAEAVDEPVAEVVEEVAEVVEEPVAEAVEEVAEAADASADESVEEPSDEAVEESAGEPVAEAAEDAGEEEGSAQDPEPAVVGT